MNTLRKKWRRFLAYFRLSESAICEESRGMGMIDFHDYHDDIDGYPDHFCKLKCKRCGKEFTI